MRKWMIIVSVCLLSSCYFLGPSSSRRYSKASAVAPLDVAIVPGLPFRNGSWDTLLKARILWACYLYKAGIVRNIIFSGNAVYTPYKEGKIMALYAKALGVPEEHIWIDTLAEHSTENLYFSYQLACKLHFRTVGIATDPFQCAMLYRFSKKHFTAHFYFLPVVYRYIEPMLSVNPEIEISTAYVEGFVPLTVRKNFRQRMRASRGSRIKLQSK